MYTVEISNFRQDRIMVKTYCQIAQRTNHRIKSLKIHLDSAQVGDSYIIFIDFIQ